VSSSSNDDIGEVAELLTGNTIAMLTTIDPDGTIMSRPMALHEVEFDGDLWFFAERSSRVVSQIEADPRVNVAVGSGSSWVSLSGTASVVDDVAKRREQWDPAVAAWFPEGPESADVVLLHIEATSAEYWNTPGGRIARLFSFAKAKVTRNPYDGGENARVEL
jgi:general stress protein 26